MPILLLDIGNTRSKAAIAELKTFTPIKNIDQFSAKQWQLMVLKHRLSHYFAGNVNTDEHPTLRIVSKLLKPISFSGSLKLPFVNRYRQKSLGQDRIAIAAAVSDLYPHKNVLVISCGTCITYDILNKDNEYLGGAISPGLQMRFYALHDYTARLPLVTHPMLPPMTGDTTNRSIQSGVIWGIVGEMNYRISEYRKKYKNIIVILSGGDARFFEPLLNSKIFTHENLVLHGLHSILKLNYPKLA